MDRQQAAPPEPLEDVVAEEDDLLGQVAHPAARVVRRRGTSPESSAMISAGGAKRSASEGLGRALVSLGPLPAGVGREDGVGAHGEHVLGEVARQRRLRQRVRGAGVAGPGHEHEPAVLLRAAAASGAALERRRRFASEARGGRSRSHTSATRSRARRPSAHHEHGALADELGQRREALLERLEVHAACAPRKVCTKPTSPPNPLRHGPHTHARTCYEWATNAGGAWMPRRRRRAHTRARTGLCPLARRDAARHGRRLGVEVAHEHEHRGHHGHAVEACAARARGAGTCSALLCTTVVCLWPSSALP